MMKRLFVTTALATVLAAGPAFAAEQKAADETKAPDTAQQQMQGESSGTQDKAQAADAGSIEFVAEQKESDWLASSLIGRAVQNNEGETLGDINEVVLDQNGDVVAVLIGVGGFLGLGGKDVAVTYSALEFKERETQQSAIAGQDARQSAQQKSATPQGSQGGGSQSPMLNKQNQGQAQAPRKDADHSDMVIVLNATAKQLESAPAFTYLGQAQSSEQGENQPAEKDAKMKPEQKTDQN